MTLRIQCLDIDCREPGTVADFWEAALGWRRTHEAADQIVLEPPEGSPEDGVSPDLLFLRVPDPTPGKNRLHLDLRPDDQEREVERLEALGAKRARVGQPETVRWIVMSDPEGNEFCVLPPLSPDQ
ncbi:VOC family protein [Actinomadura sp. DC4]|uniref:VOC family protein n=1 Tax=Actinomadura sp. DC4 TaxID=3055069 RepID=UPI0025B20772|nr:VOC family protein [Actinomadura sp. DC4]MDN3352294.1 VOC family protein [Actinomadura sp. DC4]